MPYDEAGSIVLYFIDAQMDSNFPLANKMMKMIQEIVNIVRMTCQVEFDIDKIKKAGRPIITPVLVTNAASYRNNISVDGKNIKNGEKLFQQLCRFKYASEILHVIFAEMGFKCFRLSINWARIATTCFERCQLLMSEDTSLSIPTPVFTGREVQTLLLISRASQLRLTI